MYLSAIRIVMGNSRVARSHANLKHRTRQVSKNAIGLSAPRTKPGLTRPLLRKAYLLGGLTSMVALSAFAVGCARA